MIVAASDYGPFTDLVATASALVAAGAAIGLSWRRRAKWEPAEEDLPAGPRRVGGLLAAVFIGLVWFDAVRNHHTSALSAYAIVGGTLCLIGLIAYSLLINQFTFTVEKAISPTETEALKIVGGLWTTTQAKQFLTANPKRDLQDFLRGVAYNPDRVWPRLSRGLSKLSFVLGYLVLTVGGTIAIASVSILISAGIR